MVSTNYIFCIALISIARANPLGQTVCETVPTIPNVYPLPGLPLPVPGLGSTTVCETSPNLLNLGLGYPFPPLPVPNMASTTVCESQPNLLSLGIGFPYPFNYGYLPCQYPYHRYPVPTTTVCDSSSVMGVLPVPNVAGSTTVCESTPNVLGLMRPNVPVPSSTTTVCETTPNLLPYPAVAPLPYPGLIPGYGPIGFPFYK